MSKTYLDVPVIAYQTWLIVTGYKTKDGNFIEDEENNMVKELKKQYPYNRENKHVLG